ncbi:hypothetical protein Bca101_093747 [Brassica carinata]
MLTGSTPSGGELSILSPNAVLGVGPCPQPRPSQHLSAKITGYRFRWRGEATVTGEKKMEGTVMKDAAAEDIAARLSSLEGLYFPRAVQSTTASSDQRKSILLDLLRRDPAVFLERYGSQLSLDELLAFDALKHDYEVDWHLKNLRKKISPTSGELKSRSVAVRNRRLAYLNKLVSEGQYFSEDAMRDREPYLHHEDSDEMAEEAALVSRIREEQQRLGVAECDWVGNENMEESEEESEQEEVETEDEEEEEEKQTGASSSLAEAGGAENKQGTVLPPEEMQEMMEQFTSIMQQKFLSGEDHEHLDYTKIDNDENLDDHWLREVGLDAEEKYFGESPKRRVNNLETREKLGLNKLPKPDSRTNEPLPESADAYQKIEMEKAKQDDGLADLSDLLGELKNMAIDMGTEIERFSFISLNYCTYIFSMSIPR